MGKILALGFAGLLAGACSTQHRGSDGNNVRGQVGRAADVDSPPATPESPPAAPADASINVGTPHSTPTANTTSSPGGVADTSYAEVAQTESFEDMRSRMVAEKSEVEARQQALLEQRYDLGDRPADGITQFRGKPVQSGVRAKLPEGVASYDDYAVLTPDEIKRRGLFPLGFMPLPHAKQAEGGQVLPQFHIDEIDKQEGRSLQRFDIDYDLPERFLPEFPPPVFLVTRPDLGDVARGELLTIKNYFRLLDGVLTPRELDGLRLLVTPFPQQQFNLTADRRVDEPQLGISCFDCHANGHTNAAFHLDPVTRPQTHRRRIDTPSLRGVNIQRLFGSQRALKTVEDFTEFEQLGAYFDGDQVIAAKKGFNKLDRALQVAHMAELQSILDFPPAPKLEIDGKLMPAAADAAELRGQELFFGKAKCATCHPAPYYTDNLMYDLATERFYEPTMINGHRADGDGPIKTFPLRGIKDSPPYLHDGRLLTLDDTVEFFNIVLQLKLTAAEKGDLVAFLYAL